MLGGQPGIYTANWAETPEGTRDFGVAMQRAEVALQEVGATEPAQRTGRFVAVICIAWPDGHAEYFRGEAEGHLVWPPRGNEGFGYDPVFVPNGHERTFGEMTAQEKHGWKPGMAEALSHRARAFQKFAQCDAGGGVTSDNPGFGVYIHWPFCAAKCPYCDFNSHVRHQPVDQARFAAAFDREMQTMRSRTGARTVSSIFLGGGTPSLMTPATVGAVLDSVSRHWTVPDGIEITLEANPSSVEAERFRGYRAAGVNRVSLGVQALNDADLRFLGRLHNVSEALKAIGLARDIFPRLSFDLIYARPGQTLDAWETELNEAIGYAADHLSLYQLTIEEGTRFHALHAAGKFIIPDADLAADLYELTQHVTAARGLPAYEISNHARPGAESRHNLIYWRYGEYVGIGPGAHGRFLDNGRRVVTMTEKMPETWANLVEAKGHGVIDGEVLNRSEEADEYLLMGLRLAEGIDLDRYEKLAGRSLSSRARRYPAGRGTGRLDRQFAPARNSRRYGRAQRCGGGSSAVDCELR